MFDDQTTSRWIPRNQLGLPVYGYAQAAPAAAPLLSFDATPAVAFELGWDDEEFSERRPHVQVLASPTFQPAPRQARSIAPQPVAPPAVGSHLELAADIARIRARPRVPLWLRALVLGVAVFAAVLFGVVIMFVEPSPATPVAAPLPTPLSAPAPAPVVAVAVSADAKLTPAPARAAVSVDAKPAPARIAVGANAKPAPARVAKAPAESQASVRAPAAAGGGRLGMLRLNSRPWSQVFVDGRPIGHTPIMGVPLNAGEHRVELVNEALNVRKTIQVRITPDDVVTKIVLLVD